MSFGNKKTSKRGELRLSVTELVEFSARSGNLFDAYEGPTSLEGIRGHQRIQKQRDPSWHTEYPLKQSIEHKGVTVTLQGRLDLLRLDIINPIVEEIKTTYLTPEMLPGSKKDLYWAQVKIYAYLYCLEKNVLSAVDTRVTLLNVKTQNTTTQRIIFSHKELKEFTYRLINIYIDWHTTYSEMLENNIHSAAQIKFPFPQYRPQQYDFARSVYQTIKNKRSLLVEAPTGTGKTISVLFPAIKSLGEEVSRQVVYLTIKGSAKSLAEKAISSLVKKNLSILYISIQAKDKTCPCQNSENSDSCRNKDGVCTRTIGFFDRLCKARYDCLQVKELNAERLQKIADDHHLCPFELSLQMTKWAQLIICDVNYVFDPQVHLSHFDQIYSKRVFLIDEIHNLPDRGRDMYSAELSTANINTVIKVLGRRNLAIRKITKRLVMALEALSKVENLTKPPKVIVDNVEALIEQFQQDLSHEKTQFMGNNTQVKQFARALFRFHIICEKFDHSHVCILKTENNNTALHLFCRDASHFFRENHQCARSSIGFSATLGPLDYYQKACGMRENASTYAIKPVFSPGNQLTLMCNFIDTRWKNRGQSLSVLAELIVNTFVSRPGKYLAFFPSYTYMESVIEEITKDFPALDIVSQRRNSDEQDRETFLNHFFHTAQPLVGFAILGGIFAEGVDFSGDALTGAFIVSASMPQPNIEQKHMEDYYAKQGLDAFQTVYQIPGMVRVAQTAGRVIRSETDRGVVILIDPRFSKPDFRRLMPTHWNVSSCDNLIQVDEKLNRFWRLDNSD